MKTVFVTGGAGYIGSHACVELLEAGYDVIVMDNLSNSKEIALQRVREITDRPIKFIKADLLDKEVLAQVFSEYPIDVVMHFAGLKAVGESNEKPLLYYHNNVGGAMNLFDAMLEHDVNNIVFSSSATVYGVSAELPLQESAVPAPVNPYGQTKLMIENILKDIHQSRPDWNISILRYFNPVGAHESGKIGEDPGSTPNNLMPYMARVAVGKLDKLTIFGDDYPTPDGTGIRDYIHVVDLVAGHIKALQKLTEAPGIMVHNLGTGKGCSVREMIAAFEKAAGREIPSVVTDRRPNDVAINYADCRLAETELGWRGKMGIAEMCRDTWRWQTLNPDGY